MSLRKSPAERSQRGGAPARADNSGDTEAAMTPDQAEYLKVLAGRARDPDAFDETLTAGEAAKRIAALETLLDHERDSGKERLPRT